MTEASGGTRGWIVAIALVLVACELPATTAPSTPERLVIELEPGEGPPPPRWVGLDLARDDPAAGGCAVESTGALWCWGRDPTLRAGLRALPEDPSMASRVRDIDDARAVALSGDQVCRIDNEDRVHCVGPSGAWRTIPGIEHAIEVGVVYNRLSALQADGALLFWDAENAEHPTELVAEDVLAFGLSWGGGHIIQARSLHSWWFHGGLPVLPFTLHEYPYQRSDLIDIAVSHYGAQWRLDDRGRVHMGSVSVARVRGAVEIVASDLAQCVRTPRGAVYCRGKNQYGQLGDGSTRERKKFVTMVPWGAQGLAMTDRRTCVWSFHEIACTGFDDTAPAPPEGTVHQHTIESLRAVSLAAHEHTTCAIDSDGDLRCWGWDLKARPDGARNHDFGIQLARQPTLVHEDVGSLHGFMSDEGKLDWVGSDGRIRSVRWMGKPDWRLEPMSSPWITPMPILRMASGWLILCTIEAGKPADVLACASSWDYRRTQVRGIEGPVAFAIEDVRVCAIDRRGRVVCIAHADPWDEDYDTVFPPTIIPGVRKARAIAMNEKHACALVAGGRVLCWKGTAVDTRVNETLMRREYQATAAVDMGFAGVREIAANDHEFCSVGFRGSVRCWTPENPSATLPGPVIHDELVERVELVDLVAGSDHFCARDLEGAVTCWGKDERYGQLGRVPAAVSLRPTPLRFDDALE